MEEGEKQSGIVGGPDVLRERAQSLGITIEEAQQRGLDFLIIAAIQAIENGQTLSPVHADLLKQWAAADPSVTDRVRQILEEMYPEQPS